VNDEQAVVEHITKKLADEGRIIEGGWQAMRLLVLPPTASAVQVAEMRKAFFAGAQHLFGSIMTVLDPDDEDEPTANDLLRVALIHAELEEFTAELRREVGSR
jgi:hypothetical protein